MMVLVVVLVMVTVVVAVTVEVVVVVKSIKGITRPSSRKDGTPAFTAPGTTTSCVKLKFVKLSSTEYFECSQHSEFGKDFKTIASGLER